MSASRHSPVGVLTPAEARERDSAAEREWNTPPAVLMEAAGRAAAAVVHALYPSGRVVAAVGTGSNGGDALVLLRTLGAWGREVAALPLADSPLPGELARGWELPVAEDSERALLSAGVVVDGLLGTGARGAPREPASSIILEINRSGRPVVALDGPSGVDLLTGQTPGAAVRADVTVTFDVLKRGLLRFPGRALAGRIVVAEIGLGPLTEPSALLLDRGWARAALPPVAPDAHKGTLGTVAVVAGREGMAGAAILAGTAAGRAGAGLVRLVSVAENRTILQTALPEAVFIERGEKGLGAALEDADAVLVGPGIGVDRAAAALLERVLARGDAPVLVDADAITLLAAAPELARGKERPLLLTPHPGELGRVLECSASEVTDDPFAAAREAASRFACAVLLKGSPSLVAAPGQPVAVNLTGHSGLATGGSGDTLAGVAAAFLALGCDPWSAAGLALFVSGRAAELAGRGRSLLARDVSASLPAALAWLGEPGDPPVAAGVIADLPPPS